MVAISLCQPWASLLITGAKMWETRSWKPSARSMKLIEREGLLIHASLSHKYDRLQATEPFWRHLSRMGQLPRGAIIGSVKLGEILSTEKWIKDYATYGGCMSNKPGFNSVQEMNFGDFGPGRYAWEITDVIRFEEPIPAKGRLALWSHPWPLPKKHLQLI